MACFHIATVTCDECRHLIKAPASEFKNNHSSAIPIKTSTIAIEISLNNININLTKIVSMLEELIKYLKE